nr:GNAT family N-acetyltransferase [Candidatus Sigynarchaeota archaeon]
MPADIATWGASGNNLVKKIWIAYLDGKPAGYACCQLEFDNDGISQLLFVETKEGLGQSNIAVLPECRKR